MNFPFRLAAALGILLGGWAASAQTTIFDENFDGGYTGTFGTGSYGGGSPSSTNEAVITTGGNPNGAFQETMTTTTWSDYFTGQVQLMTVSGNSDPNPSDYVLSFDAYGSQAATIQFMIQTWPYDYYGGPGPVINAVTTNDVLAAANTWQTFSVNLGAVTSALPIGQTWQLEFQINSWLWGGPGLTDTLTIDNIKLVNTTINPVILTSSFNPSTDGGSVAFTATVETNGVTASNATGQVIFSSPAGPFSTNTVSDGSATSSAITNLAVGTDLITAAYSGGNYPACTNTLNQDVLDAPVEGMAESNLWIYTDNMVNGFQNWSWATVNLENSSPVHSGSNSISVNDGGDQALAFERPEFNSSLYSSFSFWVNGGATGGQKLQVWGLLDYATTGAHTTVILQSNVWEQITIPLTALGVAGQPNVTGFWIQGNNGSAQPTFYVDDVQLIAGPLPSLVHLAVNAGQVLQTVDVRQFGLNIGTWDSNLGDAQTLPVLQEIGCSTLRWPGGSTSDEYNWANDPTGNATFEYIATNLGAQVFTTVNYGTGTAAEATAWVLSANKTNHCGFKYWEVGNECYGTWETDSHAIPHDPYTYATNAVAYILQMKAACPNVPIKVGIVVAPGEGSYSNNATHFAVNPRTGATNYGWTPIVLSEMKSLGVLPDFLIYHFYWQYTTSGWTPAAGSDDSDPLLLQVAGDPSPLNWSDWNSAATNLRQQITDYIGTAGTNIELCVTENNSDAGAMGRQSTSLVNALYLADSTGQLMKTEFRSCIFWDFQNNSETDGDFDPTIYGWRAVGDYGILSLSESPYPTYYAKELLQYFAGPNDSVLSATSDSMLLSAYAIHRTNGALTLLVINKDMTTNLTAQIALNNFAPGTNAAIQSYGIPQDQAAQEDASPSLQGLATADFSGAGTNFTYSFPPLSLTLFTFSPEPSKLSGLGVLSGQAELALQGQPGTPYIIQSASSLNGAWTSISTNTLTGTSTNINVTVSTNFPQQFYRAVWEP
jgi:alpha-N-arabinofuranosidase